MPMQLELSSLPTGYGATRAPQWQRLGQTDAPPHVLPRQPAARHFWVVPGTMPSGRRLTLAACLALAILVTVMASVATVGRHPRAGAGNLDHLEHRLTLPPGFVATQYSPQVLPDARSMALSRGDNGGATIVYVGTREKREVYVLIDTDSDGRADAARTIITGLDHPNGIVWHDGALFVMTHTKLLRFDDIDGYALTGKMPPKPVLVSDFLKDTDPRGHAWKYMAMGPDGWLYIAVGSPCDKCTCEPLGPVRYCTISRIRPDGSSPQVYASGIRNTVGITFHPDTGELWYTSNGSDHLGDDKPDDGLIRVPHNGTTLGFPQCEFYGRGPGVLREPGPGQQIYDPNYLPPGQTAADNAAGQAYCKSGAVLRPVQTLGPHVAALGVQVYSGTMFPKQNSRSVFVAEHGSWRLKRKHDIGHRVVEVRLDSSGRAVKHQIFASGWAVNSGLPDQSYWGRPVDILVMPDGALLVSDDYGGTITRIAYRG